jgi:dienelactone hydrolase
MVGVDFGSTGAPLGDGHPPGWAQGVKGKFLILHGADDMPYPLEKVAEVYNERRKAKVEFQMQFYSGAGHGFSVPKNKAEEQANAQSIVATERFLKAAFAS